MRPVRVLAVWLVALAAGGAVVLEAGKPSQVLAALAVGLAAGALVRLALGSAAGVPRVEIVRGALSSLGVSVGDLRVSERQRMGRRSSWGTQWTGVR